MLCLFINFIFTSESVSKDAYGRSQIADSKKTVSSSDKTDTIKTAETRNRNLSAHDSDTELYQTLDFDRSNKETSPIPLFDYLISGFFNHFMQSQFNSHENENPEEDTFMHHLGNIIKGCAIYCSMPDPENPNSTETDMLVVLQNGLESFKKVLDLTELNLQKENISREDENYLSYWREFDVLKTYSDEHLEFIRHVLKARNEGKLLDDELTTFEDSAIGHSECSEINPASVTGSSICSKCRATMN